MAGDGGFIKLDRKILDWEWYGNVNTKSLFLHCLIKANWQDKPWRGIVVKRGEFVTSLPSLSEEIGLTISETRTALYHLKATGELTDRKYPKYRIISIPNYNRYQISTDKLTGKRQGNRQANGQQIDSQNDRQNDSQNDRQKNAENPHVYCEKSESNFDVDRQSDRQNDRQVDSQMTGNLTGNFAATKEYIEEIKERKEKEKEKESGYAASRPPGAKVKGTDTSTYTAADDDDDDGIVLTGDYIDDYYARRNARMRGR